ncbi:AP-4 complex subunit epsilon-1-like [Dreissena polymorpha]|uniref:Clathrin/coatomer adaptor adaptin-like N-terminal domain-containing protein n=1 Tax=Dreissena polymorpha TaxID=45954 RepID=A0A9D3YP30_DREPO|nr:AP-4 complex subunit epsilon-1-like [Dreissena polymorpha]KAH3704399.1 hypothetical protein DPMN_079454 [Dreissena polymorpha]
MFGNLFGKTTTTIATGGSDTSGDAASAGFTTFIGKVSRANSKSDEAHVVATELKNLAANIAAPNQSMVQMRDYLCRVAYICMMGYEVEFACIHAVKLAQLGTNYDKRIGYLACCLLLHRNHDLILLLINTIQKDLKSSNILDNLAAMTAAAQLVPAELIPSLLPMIVAKLQHQRELVRQKAVLCLHQFQFLAPDLLAHCKESLERALLDKDPGVMAVAVQLVAYSIQRNAAGCIHLGDPLVSVLQQIVARKLSDIFNYQTIPFPWLQIQIIKCLSALVPHSEVLKTKVSSIIRVILQRNSIKEKMAFAILYECIQCIVKMAPEKDLLDESAQHVKRFVNSSNPNLQYIGVKMLVSLVALNPAYAVEYQDMIVQSLEHKDTVIHKKMHGVLYGIACEANVKVVCSKLLQQLKISSDRFWKAELATMVVSLVSRFPVEPQWQINSLFNTLWCSSGDLDRTMLKDIKQLIGDRFLSKDCDPQCQQYLLQKCISALVSDKTAIPLLQIALWIVGSLCSFLKNMEDDKVLMLFTNLLLQENMPFSIQSAVITCIHKLVAMGIVEQVSMATKLTECLSHELPLVIKQQLNIIIKMCSLKLKVDPSDTVVMDLTLTFLDDLVCARLEAGAEPYRPSHLRHSLPGQHIILTSQSPAAPSSGLEVEEVDESMIGDRATVDSSSSPKTDTERDSSLIQPDIKRVWGKQGRLDASKEKKSTPKNLTGQKRTSSEQDNLAKALFGGLQKNEKASLKVFTGFEDDDQYDDYLNNFKTDLPGPWSNRLRSSIPENVNVETMSIRNTGIIQESFNVLNQFAMSNESTKTPKENEIDYLQLQGDINLKKDASNENNGEQISEGSLYNDLNNKLAGAEVDFDAQLSQLLEASVTSGDVHCLHRTDGFFKEDPVSKTAVSEIALENDGFLDVESCRIKHSIYTDSD